MNDMNFFPDTGMGLRASRRPMSPGLNLNSPNNTQRSRLSQKPPGELTRTSPSESSLTNMSLNNLASPLRQKISLPAFLQSPSSLIQQLPASPASLLLSPLIKNNDNEQPSFFLNNHDETSLVEQIDQYYIRRRQYLQQNIDVSLNITKWVLENLVFYSVETLR